MDALAYNEAFAMSAPRTNYVPIMIPQQQQQEEKVVQPVQQDSRPSFWDMLQQSMGMGLATELLMVAVAQQPTFITTNQNDQLLRHEYLYDQLLCNHDPPLNEQEEGHRINQQTL